MGPQKTEDATGDKGALQPLLITMEDLQKTIGCGKTMAFAIVGRGDVETVQIGRRRMAVYASVKAYVDNLRAQTKLAG